jgi:hypothetical protein
MSRARKVGGRWFDVNKNAHKANVEQVKLLASVLDISIDDLLDEQLSQGEVISILRDKLGENKVPPEIEERRQRDRATRQQEPECRICKRKGDSTKHHFVNRWILSELSNYKEIASRSLCTIPVCVRCHRDLHARDNGRKSIVKYLRPHEKFFVEQAIERLRKEHLKIFELLKNGDGSVYEACLVQDWLAGKFDKSQEEAVEVG